MALLKRQKEPRALHAFMPARARVLSDDDCGRDLATGEVKRPLCIAVGRGTGEPCKELARYFDELNVRRKYCVVHARIELAERKKSRWEAA